MRYFRSSVAVYLSICGQLDAAYGYPNTSTKTARALPLASELPNDSTGRVYLAVTAAESQYILPSQLLPQLLANGAVEEITAAEYQSVLPTLP